MDQRSFIDLSGYWQFDLAAEEDAAFSGETVLLPCTLDENRKGLDNSAAFTPRYLHRDYVYTGLPAGGLRPGGVGGARHLPPPGADQKDPGMGGRQARRGAAEKLYHLPPL